MREQGKEETRGTSSSSRYKGGGTSGVAQTNIKMSSSHTSLHRISNTQESSNNAHSSLTPLTSSLIGGALNSVLGNNAPLVGSNSTLGYKETRQHMIDELIKQQQREVEIEEEINELKQNLKRYEEKLNYNNELIEQTQREIAERTKEVKLLRKSHEIFLLEILKRGKDCRYK